MKSQVQQLKKSRKQSKQALENEAAVEQTFKEATTKVQQYFKSARENLDKLEKESLNQVKQGHEAFQIRINEAAEINTQIAKNI